MGAQEANIANSAVGYKEMANAIRALTMDAVEAANSGHPGMPMGMADVATVLYAEHLSFDPSDPSWMNRDRLILSAGHGSMLLYALLYLTGYPGMDIDEIARFRKFGSKTAGHPEFGHAAGIETTTGPLGQGIANAVGMAVAERILAARTAGLVEHHTYCIAGDGCLMEGISHEAMSLAGHLGLGRLIVLFDDNNVTIDGQTAMSVSDDQIARAAACGWNTMRIDGHDTAAISAALTKARADTTKPWMIACKTIIGFGAPSKAGTAAAHGGALGPKEIAGARAALGWTAAPFEVPGPILSAWRATAVRGEKVRAAWDAKLRDAPAATKAAFATLDTVAMSAAIQAAKTAFLADPANRATRVWSQMTIEHLMGAVPQLVGGSADLSGSNGTKTKLHTSIVPGSFEGSYIHYGVREHAMAAAMNGLALHGPFVPYGGTFLVFSDYCRPAVRLSALMGQRVIYIFSHDSIGVGEDGPTHQPVEHLAALRAMPNLLVLRPADAIETAECWEIALKADATPSVLALTRDAVAKVRTGEASANLSVRGAYVVTDVKLARDVTLIATGSEVGLALEASKMLVAAGLHAAVVSMPSFELFRAQDAAYRDSVLGTAPRIAIEAGVAMGWHEWLRSSDVFIGMAGFGASAPAAELYAHFGITAEAIVTAARDLTKR